MLMYWSFNQKIVRLLRIFSTRKKKNNNKKAILALVLGSSNIKNYYIDIYERRNASNNKEWGRHAYSNVLISRLTSLSFSYFLFIIFIMSNCLYLCVWLLCHVSMGECRCCCCCMEATRFLCILLTKSYCYFYFLLSNYLSVIGCSCVLWSWKLWCVFFLKLKIKNFACN